MDGKVIKRHTIPLGGGGATGIEYVDGTLWMVASRLRALMQVNASTFQPIVAHPFQMQRPHGLAWDNGAMWVVDGADEARLVKMDAKSGATLEIIQLAAGDPDPHGLAMLDGKLYFCDAGIHPGWERDKSPHTGWVCRVDVEFETGVDGFSRTVEDAMRRFAIVLACFSSATGSMLAQQGAARERATGDDPAPANLPLWAYGYAQPGSTPAPAMPAPPG